MNTCDNGKCCKKSCTKKMLFILAGVAVVGFCAFLHTPRSNAMDAMEHDSMEHGAMMSMEAQHGGIVAYDAATFDADLADGKPVALFFHKKGCPVCAKQEPSIEKSAMEHGITVYKVDYDHDNETISKYNVGMQSTLIVFKDGKDVSNTAGVTDPVKLDEALKMAL